MKKIAIAILLVAGLTRFAALDRQSLWDDESFTLRRLGIIPAPMTMAEGAPPLYFGLLSGWTSLAGRSVQAVRAFAALWGLIGVALAGIAAGRMISPAAGLFAAAFVALHPFHLAYSQEARFYTLVLVLALAAFWTAWEKRTWWWALAATALLWAHPWGIFVWAGTAVVLRTRHAALPLLLAFPALWHFTQLEAHRGFWMHRTSWSTLWGAITALAGGPFYVGGWRFSLGWFHVVAFVGCATLWTAGILGEDGRQVRRTLLIGLAALLLLPLAAGLFVAEVAAHQRYWMATLPIAALLAARGWDRLPDRWRVGVALLLLAFFTRSTTHYFTHWEKGNIRQAAAAVRTIAAPDAVLIVPGYMQPLWRFYDRSGLPLIEEASVDEMEPAFRGRSQAVFVTLDVPNPVRDKLDARYGVLLRRRYPADLNLGLVLTVYRL